MPYNGVGVFARVYQWTNDAALGLFVDATRTDTDSNDIAAGLSNCVTRDGQSPALANLPMGGFKLTGLAVGSATADSVNYGQVFNSPSFVTPFATTSPTLLDAPLRLATVQTVINAAFAAALPAQPGTTTPAFLRSVSGVASWGENGIKGADIASAGTINLTTSTGDFVHVTGTTTITTITIPIGAERTIIFDGILTLTNGAALLLPGAANITTAAGDRMKVRGDTAGAIVVDYMRASGAPLIGGLEFLGSALVSSPAANIDFLNIFTSSYDKYHIEIRALSATSADTMAIRLAKGGVVDATAAYQSAVNSGAAMTGGQTQMTLATPVSTVVPMILSVEVRNTNDATIGVKGIGVRGLVGTSTPAIIATLQEGGYSSLNAMSGFRLFFTGGANFASALVRVYGVRNS